jgi:hypothetical protein
MLGENDAIDQLSDDIIRPQARFFDDLFDSHGREDTRGGLRFNSRVRADELRVSFFTSVTVICIWVRAIRRRAEIFHEFPDSGTPLPAGAVGSVTRKWQVGDLALLNLRSPRPNRLATIRRFIEATPAMFFPNSADSL